MEQFKESGTFLNTVCWLIFIVILFGLPLLYLMVKAMLDLKDIKELLKIQNNIE